MDAYMAPRYETLHFTKPRDHNQQDMIEVIYGTLAHDWKRLRESLRLFRYKVSGINHLINDLLPCFRDFPTRLIASTVKLTHVSKAITIAVVTYT